MVTRRVQDLLSTIYSGPIERLSTRLGVDRVLKRAWRMLRAVLLEVEYRRSSEPYTVNIEGATASFRYSTKQEFERIATLGEEADLLRDILSNVNADDVVWDVGSNVGLYVCLLASKAAEGRVIGFEPHPDHVARIRENVAINGFENVDVEQIALADASTTTELQIVSEEDHHEGKHTLQDDPEAQETIEVEVERGDEIVADDVPAPNIVKIDVEGSELETLQGMKNILSQGSCRYLQCEVHMDRGVDVDAVLALLRAAGFEAEVAWERGSEQFVIAHKDNA